MLWNLTYFLEEKIDEKERIWFPIENNSLVRIGMYHFMGYLLSITRDPRAMPKYDFLEYSSRSIMLKDNGSILWK